MSIYGTFFLLEGLYRSGHGNAATGILEASEAVSGPHSWAHVLDGLGCTVTPEAWDPAAKPNMTFSHPWGCAPACAIVEGIFGLEPLSPGFRDFRFAPEFSGLGRASLSLPTASGVISASFDGAAGTVSLFVPFGSRANVFLSGRSLGQFGPGFHSFPCGEQT